MDRFVLIDRNVSAWLVGRRTRNARLARHIRQSRYARLNLRSPHPDLGTSILLPERSDTRSYKSKVAHVHDGRGFMNSEARWDQ